MAQATLEQDSPILGRSGGDWGLSQLPLKPPQTDGIVLRARQLEAGTP